MEPFQVVVVAYLLISLYFFNNWLQFFKQKPRLFPEEIFLSLIILVIATIFWPFAVAISFLELLKARKLQLSNVMPVVLAMFLLSLITLSGLAVFGGTLPQAFSYLLRGNYLQN